jgi:hypothetical protein
MASPNITEIATVTLEARSGELADNVTRHTALLMRLNERGNVDPLDGGEVILEELEYAENGNGAWYTGYDTLQVAAQSVISAASFDWKQLAVPVIISGLDKLKNSGKAQIIKLLDARLKNAEHTMLNMLSASIYSDGTGSGGKELNGLDLAAPADPTTGTYGGIDRSTSLGTFWRSKVYDPSSTPTSSTIRGYMNTLWNNMVRGNDVPDIIAFGTTLFGTYEASLQDLQRFTNGKMAEAGFQTLKYKNADVVMENYGLGATEGFFLNTKYIRLRPHKQRNMVPIGDGDGKRMPVNQDAEVVILGWMGNLTCSNASLQGRFIGD